MKRVSKNKTVLLSAVLTVAITACFGVQRATSNQVTFTPSPAFAQVGNVSIADVANKALLSVVNIASTRSVRAADSPFRGHPLFRDFFRGRRPSPRQQRGLGSGVIVSADGIVLTNNHVVAKADKIKVTLSDKREFEAKVLGTDPKSDLAVLKLKKAKNLRPLPLGDSDKARLGHVVLAIGNPFGVGQTVTMGIVSAKGRANMGIVDYEDFIQTDAAINPGNSGGALVNMYGQLIGINTAILSRSGGYQGIGFAIPTNMAKPIMKSLLKSGKVVRGWLGVAIQDVDQDLAKAMKLPTRRGVLISDVDPSGPATRAGLKRGDLVVKIDGRAVTSSGRLRNIVAGAGAGGKIKLELWRNGKKRWISVKLMELPTRLGGTAGAPKQRSEGISVSGISQSIRNRYGLPRKLRNGVVVTDVKRGSPVARSGIRPGDVILEVNRSRIDSVSRFKQLFSAAHGPTLLLVYRGGYSQYVLFNKK